MNEMRILHTSDWHLGHNLYGYDRTEEQTAMLGQIVRITGEHRPDALIISGDIYHTGSPSAAVQRMFSETMTALRKAAPETRIIVTAGNHDSAARHEIFRTPWQLLGVDVVGTLDNDSPEKHIIEIPGKGFVAAFPYTYERNIPKGFYDSVLSMITERNTGGLPVVMMAHTTVAGCDMTGHDSRATDLVGGIEYTPLEAMGSGYDYLALGHIHRPQWIEGSDNRARYCGTPLAVSFDESYPHSVTLAEIPVHGGEVKTEEIDIENPRPLVTLPAMEPAPWAEAFEMLKKFDPESPAYIRLNVTADETLPSDASWLADKATADKKCRFCIVKITRKKREISDAEAISGEEFRRLDPMEVARRFAADTGREFTTDMEELFAEAVRRLDSDPEE